MTEEKDLPEENEEESGEELNEESDQDEDEGSEEEEPGQEGQKRRRRKYRKKVKIRKRVRIKKKTTPKKKAKKMLETVAWVVIIAAFIFTLVMMVLQLDLDSKHRGKKRTDNIHLPSSKREVIAFEQQYVIYKNPLKFSLKV